MHDSRVSVCDKCINRGNPVVPTTSTAEKEAAANPSLQHSPGPVTTDSAVQCSDNTSAR